MLALNKIWGKKGACGVGEGKYRWDYIHVRYYFSMEVELLLTGVL